MANRKRKLKISLEAVSGNIGFFFAFLNDKRIIGAEGTEKPEWEEEVPDAKIKLKVRVVGVGNAEYRIKIDLPGNINDQNLIFELEEGYHEFELEV